MWDAAANVRSYADVFSKMGEAAGGIARQNALAGIGQQYQTDPEGATNALLSRGWFADADAMRKRQDEARLAEAYRTAAANAPRGQNPGVTALIGAGQPGQAGNLQNVYTSQINTGNAQADRAREAEERTIGELKNIAQIPDLTPEQWGRTLDLFKTSHPQYAGGIERFRDFNTGLPLLRGKLGIEPSRPKAGLVAVQPGATLFDPASGKAIYTAPPKMPGGLSLPPGVDAKMAEKAVEATDSADNILDAIAALKDTAGVRQADGSYKFHPDIAAAVGPEPEFGGLYRGAKAMVGITGAAGGAQRLAQAKQNIVSQITALYNKGQGAISDSERAMYAKLIGDLESSPNEATFFSLVGQVERLTQSVRDRHAARRPIGLEDAATGRREGIALPLGGNPVLVPPQASRPGAGASNAPQPGNLPRITGDTDPAYLQLPSGSPYVGPDGHTRVKR